MMLKRMHFLVTIPLGLVCSYCSLFDRHEVIHTRAEITSIEPQSDTSVLVNIEVLRKSSAYSCEFKMLIDTISPISNRRRQIEISRECDLKRNYELVVGGLKKNIKYYYQLSEYGTFDLGGPNQRSGGDTGKGWEYVIKD